MITRIEAYRYRCFERLQLDLGPYQVLVGRNGAGKSTLLDIPVLLGEMLESRSIDKAFFGDRGRLAPRAVTPLDLVFAGKGDWFSLAIEVLLPDVVATQLERKSFEEASPRERAGLVKNPDRAAGSFRYEIAFRVTEGTVTISQEQLFLLPRDRALIGETPAGLWGDQEFYNTALVRRVINRGSDGICFFDPEVGKKADPQRANMPLGTPALAGAPVDLGLYGATEWLRNHLGRDVLPVNLDLSAMRQPQRKPAAGSAIAADGTTLPWSVMALQDLPDRHQEWIDHVSAALPLLENVTARAQDADGRAYLEVLYRTGFSVKSIGLSDGTLTLLALSILPFLDNIPAFVAVEEPENGIHPKAIEVLLESLQAVTGSQIWVTTHSPIVVAVTKPEHLLCLSLTKDKGVQIQKGIDHPVLSTWEGIPSLDVLFNAGVL